MKSVTIIGLGTMGSAIQARLSPHFDLALVDIDQGNIADAAGTDAIILAVKPQHFMELHKQLKPFVSKQLILSIMAGVSVETISKALGSTRIIRTMPNLALKTGQSMTAALAKTASDRGDAEQIIAGWGGFIWLDDESLFDAFTALAGSGPAYFFKVAAAMKSSALTYGFNEEQADAIAINTFKGAASVIDHNPAAWIAKVASKGGTTEAALHVFAERSFDKILSEAIQAACDRSKEL